MALRGRSSQDKTWEGGGKEEMEEEERGGSSFPPMGFTINQSDLVCKQIQCPWSWKAAGAGVGSSFYGLCPV